MGNLRNRHNFVPIVQNESAVGCAELVSAWEPLSGAIRLPYQEVMMMLVIVVVKMMVMVMISKGQRAIPLSIGGSIVRRNVEGVQRCPPARVLRSKFQLFSEQLHLSLLAASSGCDLKYGNRGILTRGYFWTPASN